MEPKQYDALIMVTPADYLRVESQYPRLLKYMPVRKIIFVGSKKVGELVVQSNLGERIGFLDEEELLPFDSVHKLMKEQLKDNIEGDLPRGITGWYYQQFLKMCYADICQDEYYMVWDGDTVPCKEFSMFRENTDIPYLDLKTEYHEDYFETLSKLLPSMSKCIEKSFIAEHMLMRCDIMKSLICDIENNQLISGKYFWEKIIYSITPEKLLSNSFSEFETYGTYVALKYLNAYRLRDWHSFRYAGEFFELDQITEKDFEWLGKDFFAASFEKGNSVREDHKNLFDNPEYQKKMSARQMLELAQQEFGEECYHEIWNMEKEKARLAIIEASKYETEGNYTEMFRSIRNGLIHDFSNYELYYMLGYYYLQKNINQAYLCMQNALFYCKEPEDRKLIENDMVELRNLEQLTVKDTVIVIVSYNSAYLMKKNIESIRKNCNLVRASEWEKGLESRCHLIVVDNASDDGIVEWLREQDDIILVENKENRGFAIACNQAVSKLNDIIEENYNIPKQQYGIDDFDILLLNNDTRISPNALFWLKMGLYEFNNIGATGSISNYAGNKQELNLTFSLPDDYIEYAKTINVPEEFPYEERVRLSGFSMLIKAGLWNDVGGMDENFSPGYFEDDDLCMKLRRSGYRFLICKNSFIYHAGSQSFASRSDTEQLLLNHYHLFVKKYGFDIVSLAYPQAKVVEEIQNAITEKRKRSVLDSELNIVVNNCGLGAEIGFLRSYYPNVKLYGMETNLNIWEIVAKDPNIYKDVNEIKKELGTGKIDIIILDKDNQTDVLNYADKWLNQNSFVIIREN